MNIRPVFHLISYLVMMSSGAMLASAGVGFLCHDSSAEVWGILRAALETLLLGGLVWVGTRGSLELSRKDGFGIVVFGWLAMGLVGMLPFMHTGAIVHPVDAWFETLSGFTTTGASILREVDGLPCGVLFWRSLTQWLGGMGVLLLCVAILPFLGVGGMQIYRAEMPGPSKDRLTPRIASTAKLLWGVYCALTLAEALLLRWAGMSWFDAVNYSFCTLSTGGFATHTASAGYFESVWIQLILIVFMLLGGVNFALHFRALRGDVRCYWRSTEVRVYLVVFVVASVLFTGSIYGDDFGGLGVSLIAGLFQAASILTTTGFANADYDLWSNFDRSLLFGLMFFGGCAGSTTGGLKIIRIHVMMLEIMRQVKLFMQPQAVLKVKVNHKSVDRFVVGSICAMVMGFFAIFSVATVVMTLFTPNLETAASATMAALGNIGPGLNAVGPAQNFADIPMAGKLFLSLLMLMGRLELFTVLVVMTPNFWRR